MQHDQKGPSEQFGARMDSAMVAFVMKAARADGRKKSDAARFMVEAGAAKLRELGGFPALVSWLKTQAPFGAEADPSPRKKK